jgi:hypothetical protein
VEILDLVIGESVAEGRQPGPSLDDESLSLQESTEDGENPFSASIIESLLL